MHEFCISNLFQNWKNPIKYTKHCNKLSQIYCTLVAAISCCQCLSRMAGFWSSDTARSEVNMFLTVFSTPVYVSQARISLSRDLDFIQLYLIKFCFNLCAQYFILSFLSLNIYIPFARKIAVSVKKCCAWHVAQNGDHFCEIVLKSDFK